MRLIKNSLKIGIGIFSILFFLSPLYAQEDSLEIKEGDIIMVFSSSQTIDSLKQKQGGDFYIGADDANFYFSEGIDYLEDKNYLYKMAEDNQILKYKAKDSLLVYPLTSKYWQAIFFTKGQFHSVYFVDIEETFETIFDTGKSKSPEQ